MKDDDADDSTDRRLVIDEGDTNDQAITGREIQENDVPKCQGCGKREARFVCAGCSNQWYCSKDCQVSIKKTEIPFYDMTEHFYYL